MRIFKLTKECLEVALFSNIDAFVKYLGYPSPSIVSSVELLDEDGCGYNLSVSNETLKYQRIEISEETTEFLFGEVLKYLRIYGDPHSVIGSGDLKVLFDEFEKQLGVTF